MNSHQERKLRFIYRRFGHFKPDLEVDFEAKRDEVDFDGDNNEDINNKQSFLLGKKDSVFKVVKKELKKQKIASRHQSYELRRTQGISIFVTFFNSSIYKF